MSERTHGVALALALTLAVEIGMGHGRLLNGGVFSTPRPHASAGLIYLGMRNGFLLHSIQLSFLV